ncbi:MAG: T9SS type A sorting domain-containing protein [Saprospiraceae bacterium]|nr:T9SS type A sorting domain-containing protein [Saprospiraceae bacterium]
MNKLLILIVLCLSYISLNAQNYHPCVEPGAFEFLHGNDIKARFSIGGGITYSYDTDERSYLVPFQAGQDSTQTIFTTGLWLTGTNTQGDYAVAARTYTSYGNDYWAGPLDDLTGDTYVGQCEDFDRIWQVRRFEIMDHIVDFNDNNVINRNVPNSILGWPGRGNPNFFATMGFNLPNQDLAPFYDRNGNGIYEPLLGDYPVYEHGNASAIADDMLWYVYNDNGNIHTLSNSNLAMKMEVQITAYSLYCEGNDLLNRSVFLKHKIINKSGGTWYDFRAGLWNDLEIGCYNDDYVGTAPNLNTVYAYNKTNNDANCFSNGGTYEYNGYGTNPPVQAMTFLNQPMYGSMYSNIQLNGDPSSASIFHYLLNSMFHSSLHLHDVGDGKDVSGNITNHVFHDNPNDPTGWSMYTENLMMEDLNILGTAALDSITNGEAFMLDVVYSYHRDMDSTNLGNVNLMYDQVPILQQFYDNGSDLSTCNQKAVCSSNCVYPGDMNNNGIANDFDILTWGVARGQNASAIARNAITVDWWPYDLPNTTSIPQITNAYIDANGDASIDTDDFDVNTDNHLDQHSAYNGSVEGYNTTGTDLKIERLLPQNPPIYWYHLDSILNVSAHDPFDFTTYPDYAMVDLSFGDSLSMINDLYGLTFRVSYDQNVFALDRFILMSESELSSDTWLSGKERQINQLGEIHYVAVRTDGNATNTGFGDLGSLLFRLRSSAPVNGTSVMNTDICFSDFKAIDASGNTISIGGECVTIQYTDSSAITSTPKLAQNTIDYQVSLMPNPTTGNIWLSYDLPEAQTTSVQIFDAMGRMLIEQAPNYTTKGEQQFLLETQDLNTGIYYCRVQIGQEIRTLKFVKTE